MTTEYLTPNKELLTGSREEIRGHIVDMLCNPRSSELPEGHQYTLPIPAVVNGEYVAVVFDVHKHETDGNIIVNAKYLIKLTPPIEVIARAVGHICGVAKPSETLFNDMFNVKYNNNLLDKDKRREMCEIFYDVFFRLAHNSNRNLRGLETVTKDIRDNINQFMREYMGRHDADRCKVDYYTDIMKLDFSNHRNILENVLESIKEKLSEMDYYGIMLQSTTPTDMWSYLRENYMQSLNAIENMAKFYAEIC